VRKLEPPPSGSIFRFAAIPPEDPKVSHEERERQTAKLFAQMDAHCRPDTSRHPGMHKTRTIDYVVLLSGEVTLLLDKGELDLKPFDVVVQRGTSHAWVNNGKEPALIAACESTPKRSPKNARGAQMRPPGWPASGDDLGPHERRVSGPTPASNARAV